MKRYILDFYGKQTREQIHDHLSKVLMLPDHYGNNLDALYDCLQEITEPSCIGVYNVDASNGYLESLAGLLADISHDNPNVCVFFAQQWLNDSINQ